jgi:hypothetical protein
VESGTIQVVSHVICNPIHWHYSFMRSVLTELDVNPRGLTLFTGDQRLTEWRACGHNSVAGTASPSGPSSTAWSCEIFGRIKPTAALCAANVNPCTLTPFTTFDAQLFWCISFRVSFLQGYYLSSFCKKLDFTIRSALCKAIS